MSKSRKIRLVILVADFIVVKIVLLEISFNSEQLTNSLLFLIIYSKYMVYFPGFSF